MLDIVWWHNGPFSPSPSPGGHTNITAGEDTTAHSAWDFQKNLLMLQMSCQHVLKFSILWYLHSARRSGLTGHQGGGQCGPSVVNLGYILQGYKQTIILRAKYSTAGRKHINPSWLKSWLITWKIAFLWQCLFKININKQEEVLYRDCGPRWDWPWAELMFLWWGVRGGSL